MPNVGTADEDKFEMPKTDSENPNAESWKGEESRELKAKFELIPMAKFATPKAKSENLNAETPKKKSYWRNAKFHLAVKVH